MSLPYAMEVVEAEDGVTISIPDLPGCVAYGESYEDAKKSLVATKRLWIEGKLESDQPIPEPTEVEAYSGKFVLRIPRTLHKRLDEEARQQGVSLNHYVSSLLSERHAAQNLSAKLLPQLTSVLTAQLINLRWHSPGFARTYSFSGELPGDFGLLPHVCMPGNEINILYRHGSASRALKEHAKKQL